MKRSDFKNKLAEEVHAGLKGFINYILAKADHLPDGSIKIRKAYVERWKRMSNSTHYKLRENEKVWANTVTDRIMHVMSSFKKNATKTPPDPQVTEIKLKFVEYAKNLRGFDAQIDHAKDGALIKKRLLTHSKEILLDCFDWFLTDKEMEKLSPSISTALSTYAFNKFLSKH